MAKINGNPENRRLIHIREQPSGKYVIQEIECDESDKENLGGLIGFQELQEELPYDTIEALRKAFGFERINRHY